MGLSFYEKYKETAIRRSYPIDYKSLEDGFKALVCERSIAPPLQIYSLSNAYVSPYGALLKNGMVVKESVYSMVAKRTNNLTFLKKIVLGKVKKIENTCLVALNPFSDNYYHWLIECLPRLFACIEMRNDITVLLPARSPKFITEYTHLLGFTKVEYIAEEGLVKAKEIIFPSQYEYGVFHPELLQNMRDFFLQCTPITSTLPRKLFLSRRLAKYRNSDEEPQVLNLLKEMEYEEVVPESLSVKDQISLFANTSHLVGIHGAGLSNLLFMKNGKLCVDIINPVHYDQAFLNLSQINHIPFKFFLGSRIDAPKSSQKDNIKIDIAGFKKETMDLLA